MDNYVVVGQHSWNQRLFTEYLQHLPGKWVYCETDEEYKAAVIDLKPRYVFFVHWSKLVPDWVISEHECIVMHPTDLPYGRGGTPIQNMITRGHENTTVTAFRMTEEVDAGPIYYQVPMTLRGTLRQIFAREMHVIYRMIQYIIKYEPVPEPQAGDPVYFSRRTPKQSVIDPEYTIAQIFDHVRMLSAPGYPPAFINLNNVTIEFDGVEQRGEELIMRARVKVRKDV